MGLGSPWEAFEENDLEGSLLALDQVRVPFHSEALHT